MAIIYSFAKVDQNDSDPAEYVIIRYDDGLSLGAGNPRVFATVPNGAWQDARDIVDALNA